MKQSLAATGAQPPTKWDDTSAAAWPEDFLDVEIPGESRQPAYLFKSPSAGKPLVASLHTWSGDYRQKDPLAALARKQGWNYIHPNFQGPNNRPEACLSPQALADIDSAIFYALEQTGADRENIFIAGASGGGYAALGAYLKTRCPVKGILAWVPISDLRAWYWQSANRENRYASDVLKCTSSGAILNEPEALARSPLHWPVPEKPPAFLEIYAGIDDGYTGSVPISQSLLFFNKMAVHSGQPGLSLTEDELCSLVSRGAPASASQPAIEGRRVLFSRSVPGVSVTIFQGAHEMLSEHCFRRLVELSKTP